MKGNIMLGIIIVVFLINLITFAMYGIDKKKAIKNEWRIPEARLIGMAFAFGGLGAFLGMQLFRHKTKHIKFVILVPMALILEIIIAILLIRKFY